MNASEIFGIRLKEIPVERLNEHLFAQLYKNGSCHNSMIKPVFLVNTKTGETHSEWVITRGTHGGLLTFGYFEEDEQGYHYHSQEFYSTDEIPFQVFVPEEYDFFLFEQLLKKERSS